jgi:hypothetical protein
MFLRFYGEFPNIRRTNVTVNELGYVVYYRWRILKFNFQNTLALQDLKDCKILKICGLALCEAKYKIADLQY